MTGKRSNRPPVSLAARRRANIISVLAALFLSATLLMPGIYLIVERETGTRTTATVNDCQTTGEGKYERTDCTGSWIVGGSLLAGGHVVVGTIQGVDTVDQGKTIDVTIHGDEAYSRSLLLPLLLIGLGALPFVILAFARTRA